MKKKKSKGYKPVAIEVEPPPPPPVILDQEEVEEAPIQDVDYSEGVVRRHQILFINSGDFFIQVGVPEKGAEHGLMHLKAENAIFKIHRHFLITHSPVWTAMLSSLPGGEAGNVEEKPWVLDDTDKSAAWELFLSSFYRQ